MQDCSLEESYSLDTSQSHALATAVAQPVLNSRLNSRQFFMRCGAAFDEKSVPPWTRGNFRGFLGVTHKLV